MLHSSILITVIPAVSKVIQRIIHSKTVPAPCLEGSCSGDMCTLTSVKPRHGRSCSAAGEFANPWYSLCGITMDS